MILVLVLTDVDETSWLGGAAAGLVGGVVFGLMLSMMMPSVMSKAIPALVGVDRRVSGPPRDEPCVGSSLRGNRE